MDMVRSEVRKLAAEDYSTVQHLEHASQQARERNYQDFLIVDVDAHHYESESYKDGDYFAYSNYCVHSGGPACEGLMINRVVDVIAPDRTYQGQTFSDDVHFVCPWHGYEFELRTGECVGDRRLRLKKFDVVRRGDDIFVVA